MDIGLLKAGVLIARSIHTQQKEGLLQLGLVAMTLCMLWLLQLNPLLNDIFQR